MGAVTTAILEQVADVMVTLNQSCIATALSAFQINISNAQVVDISNVNVTSHNDVNVQNCKSNSNVQLGPLQTELTKRLNATIVHDAVSQWRGDTQTLIATIVQTVTIAVTTTCYAMALNSVLIRVGNVKNKAIINNINVKQTARASIASCLQNVQISVGDITQPQSLGEYLLTHEKGLAVIPATNSVISPSGKIVNSSYQPSCPTPTAYLTLTIVIASITFFIVLLTCCGLLLWQHKTLHPVV